MTTQYHFGMRALRVSDLFDLPWQRDPYWVTRRSRLSCSPLLMPE